MPVRFLSFSIIGGFGVLVHMAVLTSLLAYSAADFVVWNYVVTQVYTWGSSK